MNRVKLIYSRELNTARDARSLKETEIKGVCDAHTKKWFQASGISLGAKEKIQKEPVEEETKKIRFESKVTKVKEKQRSLSFRGFFIHFFYGYAFPRGKVPLERKKQPGEGNVERCNSRDSERQRKPCTHATRPVKRSDLLENGP